MIIFFSNFCTLHIYKMVVVHGLTTVLGDLANVALKTILDNL